MGFRRIRKSCFICLFAFPLIGCLVLPNGESLDFDGCDIGAEADPAFLGACEDRTGREWQFVGKPTLPPPEYGADGPIDCYWIP